jgi:hypothetical protein
MNFSDFVKVNPEVSLTIKKNKFITNQEVFDVFNNNKQINAEIFKDDQGMYVGRIFKDKYYTGEYETEPFHSKTAATVELSKLWLKYLKQSSKASRSLQDEYDELFNKLDDIQKQKTLEAMRNLEAEGEEGLLPAIRYMKRKFSIDTE